jgi:prepilin-type N-terminal cleavage/methylation domain-containing protein
MTGQTGKSNSPGFSLIEMIVVVSIVGILLGIAIPTYLAVVPAQDLKADARKIMFALQRARLVTSSYNRPTRVLLDCTPATLTYDGEKNPCRLNVELAVYDETGVVRRWIPVQAGKMDLSPSTVVAYKSSVATKREQFDYYQSFFQGFHAVNGDGPRTYGVYNLDGFNGDSLVVVFVPSGEAITYSKVILSLKSSRKESLPGWTVEVINSTGNVRVKEETA